MPGFVIEFNRHTGQRRVTEFATPREAMVYRLKLEADRTDRNIEIVALTRIFAAGSAGPGFA